MVNPRSYALIHATYTHGKRTPSCDFVLSNSVHNVRVIFFRFDAKTFSFFPTISHFSFAIVYLSLSCLCFPRRTDVVFTLTTTQCKEFQTFRKATKRTSSFSSIAPLALLPSPSHKTPQAPALASLFLSLPASPYELQRSDWGATSYSFFRPDSL